MEKQNGLKDFLLTSTGKYAMIAVFCLVIWGIAIALVSSELVFFAFIFFIIFAYYGWKALAKITPNIFLIMPIIGWVVYFVIKGLLAFFIGVFVAPFEIAKKITAGIQGNIK